MSRSVLPITQDIDREYFGGQGHEDQIGLLEGARSRFGRTYVGEPDRIARDIAPAIGWTPAHAVTPA